MAKSLFNQFAQIRGSRTYSDSLNLTLAEITGRTKEAGLIVDISGTTVTRQSGVFEKRDVGNFLVIGGSAYGITAANGTASCTVSSAPGDGSGISAALMYYQNLEDDLNYIRTMLKEITGEAHWYTPPDVALSELTFNFIELVDVFIGGGAYTANNMLYTVSSGVKDTNQVTFNPTTNMFTAANITTGGTLDVDGAADFDSTLNVQGGVVFQSTLDVGGAVVFQNNVTVSGTFQFDEAGQPVNEIVTSISAASTNAQLPTALAVYTYVDTVAAGIDTFLELGDTFSFYTANNMMYTTASGIQDTNKITYNPGTDTFAVSAAITNITGVANLDNALDVDGATTLNSSLDVDGAVDMHSTLTVDNNAVFKANVVVSGALQFDAGQTVDAIVTSISEPGADTNLATEQAIVEYVTLVSGVLFNQIESIDTFLELEDTPNLYNNGALVYSQSDQIAFTSEINYTGSALNIFVPIYVSQGIRTDGNIIVGQSLTVTGTSTLIGNTNVQGSLDVDTNLNVDGSSVVVGNNVVGGNVTVSGSFQFDASGQAVNEITTDIPISGPGSDSKLVTEAGIFEFVNTVSGVLAASTAAQTYLALTDTESTGYTAGNMLYMTGSGIMDTNRLSFAGDSFTVSGVSMYVDIASGGAFELKTVSGGDEYFIFTYDGLDNTVVLSGDTTTVNGNDTLLLSAAGDSTIFRLTSGMATVFMPPSVGMDPVRGITLSGVSAGGGFSNVMFSLQKGSQVNEIVNIIADPPQPELKLPTVKALMDYVDGAVTTASGHLDEFIELNDTPNNYSNTKLVYSTSSNIQYADNLSYTGSGLIVSGTLNTTGAVFFDSTLDVDGITTLNNALDVDGATTLNSSLVVSGTTNLQGATDIDSSLNVDGAATFNNIINANSAAYFNDNVLVSGTFQFDSTGQAVNEISTSIDPAGGDNTTLVTENAVWSWVNTVSGVLAAATAAQTFLALTDTPSDYTDDKYKLVRVNDSETGLIFESALTFSGTTFNVNGGINATGSLSVDGAAEFNNNVTVDGTFGFDTGTTVTEIATSMSAPGDNDTLLTEAAIYNWVNTVSGSLQSDVIWEIVDTPYTQIRPKAAHMGKAIYTSGDVTIGGNLTVSGTTTTINTNELTVEDKLITVNAGEVGAGITGDPLAGIEIDRGSEANYLFVFNEESDNFRVGVSGSLTPGNTFTLQAVCTREDNPIDLRVPWWDATNFIYRNTGDTYISVNSGTHTLNVVADSDTKMQVAVDNVKIYGDTNDYVEINSNLTPLFKVVLDGNTELDITSSGLALDNGARVDDITTVIAEPGDDMTLATEKAIVDYVTQVSGVLAASTAAQTFLALTDTHDVNYIDGRALRYTASGVEGTPFINAFPLNDDPTISGVTLGSMDYGNGETAYFYLVKSDMGPTAGITVSDPLSVGSILEMRATHFTPRAGFGEAYNGVTYNSTIFTGPQSPLFLESENYLNIVSASGTRIVSDTSGTFNTQVLINANGLRLASGADVNDIVISISEPGSDDKLATEQAIVEYVNTASGVLQYNIDHVKFLDLDDVEVGSFTANYMLYLTSSGVQKTSQVQFNPTTDTFTIRPGGALLGEFSPSTQTIGNNEDTFIRVSQDNDNIVLGRQSIAEVTVNSDGLALKTGASVNKIGTAMTPTGDDDTLLTEKAIYDWVNTVSGVLSAATAAQTFLALTDTPSDYADDAYKLLRVNDTQSGVVFESALTFSGTTFSVSGNVDATGNLTVGGSFTANTTAYITGILTAASGVNIAGNTVLGGSFTLGGQEVNDIITSITEPGSDSNLVTEQAIVEYVTATSGVLQTQIDVLEAIHQDTEEPTGFVNRLDSTLSNDGANVTVSGASWDYYIKGVKYTINGEKSAAIDTAFEGMQYFYMDTDQTLKRMNSWSDDLMTDYAYVAAIYWDDTNNAVLYMGDERHGVVMDAATHKYLHTTKGTVYISGLGITVVSGVDGNGSVNGHAQIGTSAGVIADEDVYHNIATMPGPAAIPVFYKVGNSGLWRKTTTSGNFPVRPYSGGSNRLAYNQFVGGTWQQTEVGKGDFVLAHIFATNDPNMQWIAVQGQATYDTNTEARLGATTEMNNLILTGLPFVEFVPVATLIYQTDEDFTNDINARIISTDEGKAYIDWTKSNLSPVPGSVTDHGNLSGLEDLDHPASAIYTDTTNFNGALSSADNTVQKALDTLDNAIAGIGHEHFDVDCVEVSTNVWEYNGDSTFTTVPADLQVFVNGLKNRKHTDYYTASIVSGRIRITFAYNVYSEDWINITYTKAAVS